MINSFGPLQAMERQLARAFMRIMVIIMQKSTGPDLSGNPTSCHDVHFMFGKLSAIGLQQKIISRNVTYPFPTDVVFVNVKRKNLDHLMLRCSYNRDLWNCSSSLFGTQFDFSKDLEHFFVTAMKDKVRSQIHSLCQIGIFATLWKIWSARNKLVFFIIKRSILDPRKHGF